MASSSTFVLRASTRGSACRSVVDVAGGPGGLLSGVVQQHPHLHGHATVLERPAVVHALDLAAAEKQGVKFVPGGQPTKRRPFGGVL
jgi:hypothetical protein